jgi:hypothetical protein
MTRDATDVFILGAGFARAIAPSMPLLQDLAERIREKFQPRNRIPPAVAAMMQENFAHALSYLEQAKPWVTEADNLRLRALFLDISNAIAHDLDETVKGAAETLGRDPPAWLSRLLRHWHEHRCTVLTLNYDTLIETAAAQLDGGGVRIQAADIYPPLLTDAGLRSGGPQAERRGESFRLLKLHGSTNWYYSGRTSAHGEPIYFVPPPLPGRDDDNGRREHEQRLKAVADKYPFLVPPIYDKSPLLTHETIRALWFEAGEALKLSRRVVCMGYSLPESDLTMQHFLRTTCRDDACIAVVNQSDQAIGNFERLFRGTHVRVEPCANGKNCIADFVEDRKRGLLAGSSDD